MKRIFLSLATALITILGISAQNTYNMVIEMNNGTKINIGPNDIKNISFVDGDLTISGESIDEIKKEIADLKQKLDEQKSCECSKEIEALKQEIANLNTSDIIAVINVLELQIKSLTDEVAALKGNSGNDDNQGGGNDDSGDSGSSTINSQLVGVWYQYLGGSIVGFCFYDDGTGWKGEWESGRSEEHRPLAWVVEGNRLRTYNAKDGDQLDDYTFSISGDGNTLTLTDTKSGYSEVFKRQ